VKFMKDVVTFLEDNVDATSSDFRTSAYVVGTYIPVVLHDVVPQCNFLPETKS
jgi:hypothetical protein